MSEAGSGRKVCGGIDAGSRTIKIVLMDADTQEVVASGIVDQGIEQNALATQLLEDLTHSIGVKTGEISRIVATGYARNVIRVADTTVTEITCHATGVYFRVPGTRTVIEIGGQDSKFLRLNEGGNVRDFAMNDRCAAGTGRFLEVVADRLGVEVQGLGELAANSRSPAVISSMCVVFAETEIIGLLASGIPREDIVAGVQMSIASRVSAMAGRNIDLPIVFTGGVALISGMATALESALKHPVSIAPDPQMTGALGAALLASRQCKGDSL
ncbi:MAG: acyl-CoA dehydratase activase [bacterium]